jgi:S1-C subfamily serine protease
LTRAPRRGPLPRALRAVVALGLFACAALPAHAADRTDTIARVKRSIVGVGTLEPARQPPFAFRATGFAVGDGTTIATNAHALPAVVDLARNEVLAVLVHTPGERNVRIREVRRLAVDPGSDLALLALDGEPLVPLPIRDSDAVREGQEVLITGYPIGAVLGPFPVTHRGMVSAVTPIAIPQGRAAELDPALVHRLSTGAFPVFQLDATAYPGNSGSPIYDPATGEVLGIVNMVFVKSTKESVLATPSGITYAVPVNHLLALMKSAPASAAKR